MIRRQRLATLALAVVTFVAACDAFYQVNGKVRSCHDQKPIPGARVQLTYPGERGANSADDSGAFSVAVNDLPGENPATLSADAPGFQHAERTVYHSTEESQDICLQPANAKP